MQKDYEKGYDFQACTDRSLNLGLGLGKYFLRRSRYRMRHSFDWSSLGRLFLLGFGHRAGVKGKWKFLQTPERGKHDHVLELFLFNLTRRPGPRATRVS